MDSLQGHRLSSLSKDLVAGANWGGGCLGSHSNRLKMARIHKVVFPEFKAVGQPMYQSGRKPFRRRSAVRPSFTQRHSKLRFFFVRSRSLSALRSSGCGQRGCSITRPRNRRGLIVTAACEQLRSPSNQ